MLTFIFYIIGSIIGLMIFYYVVKTAVKHGIIEAKYTRTRGFEDIPLPPLNLHKKYNNGEITFEEFQAEMEKS
jgi:hypothetical protein